MTGGKGHLRCILTGGTGETRDDKDKQPGNVTAAAYFFGSIDGVLRGFLVNLPEGGCGRHIPPSGCNFELFEGNFSFSMFLVEKARKIMQV